MKIEVTPARLCHGLHCSCSSVSSYLVFLSFSLAFIRSSVRVLGVAVLSCRPVPTLTPSLPRGVALSHRITGGLLRSQLVAIPSEDGVAGLTGRQLLK